MEPEKKSPIKIGKNLSLKMPGSKWSTLKTKLEAKRDPR